MTTPDNTHRIGEIVGYRTNGLPVYLVGGGSEPTIDTNDSQGSVDTQQQDTGNDNAAPWASYLNELPEGIRPLVEPKLKEWDSDVTKRFQQVHSQYEPLKPFQSLVENGIDFESVQAAVQFAQLVNEDPKRVYDALVEQYGYGSEQGQVEPEPDSNSAEEEDLFAKHPELARYREMTDQMAEIMVNQQRAEEMAAEEAALDAQLASLKEQHGDFDEDYVMTKVYAGATWEDAINAFNALRGPADTDAPVVMGSGGGLPSQSINPAQMSDKDRRALVAQIAAQANK